MESPLKMIQSVLVVGATGFLGSNLVSYFNRQKIHVRIFRRSTSETEKLKDFIGDMTSKEDLRSAIDGCEVIFYLAACTSLSRRKLEERWRTNVEGFSTFLSNLVALNFKGRLIYCSSVGAIGCSKKPQLLSEEDQLCISEFDYFQTKRKAEEMVLEAAKQGLDAVIVNPATLFGLNGKHIFMNKIFFSKNYFRLLCYPVGGTSLTFVEDVCQGMLSAACFGKKGERYILAGHNLTFYEIFKRIAQNFKVIKPMIPLFSFFLIGMAHFFEKISWHSFGVETAKLASRFSYYSSQKAMNELNYTITSVTEGFKKMNEAFGVLR